MKNTEPTKPTNEQQDSADIEVDRIRFGRVHRSLVNVRGDPTYN